jgi:hypothetical protein
MLSALLIGFNVEVPEGRTVGGTFKETPLCTRVGQTGCVVSYVSFRAPTRRRPGRAVRPHRQPGMTGRLHQSRAARQGLRPRSTAIGMPARR